MTNNSNEATKEFSDFFVQLATAFNKIFTDTDIQTWWKEFGYDSTNLGPEFAASARKTEFHITKSRTRLHFRTFPAPNDFGSKY